MPIGGPFKKMRITTQQKKNLRRIAKAIGVVLLFIVLIAIIAGLIPVSTDGLGANPNPSSNYDEAMGRFQTVLDTEAPIVNEASGSLLMTHGEPTEQVYIMIHGITNSPHQWQELGEMLYDQGANVLIMRMPYHGLKSHNVGELGALSAVNLRDYGDQVVDIAAGLGDEITVIGLSGGATVTSWIGQNRPEVAMVIPISPYMGVPELPAFMDTFIMNLGHNMPNFVLDEPGELRRPWVYRGETTRAPAEFMILGRSVLNDATEKGAAVETAYFLTTAVDNIADNTYTERLVALWKARETSVSYFQFDASQNIPHNSIDPTTDVAIRTLVYDKLFEIIGTKE